MPMARGSFGCSLDNVLISFTNVFNLNFVFISWPSEPLVICRTLQGSCCVSGTPDPTPSRVFIQRSIVHSSLIIWALRSPCRPRRDGVVDPNLSTGDRACRWFAVGLVAHWTTSLHLSPMSVFVFCFCFLAFRAEANLSHSAGGHVLRERHSGSNTISGLYPTVNRAFVSHHSYCAV